MIKLEPSAGRSISEACREACSLAAQSADSVEFEFNGTRVRVHAGEQPGSIERIWWLTREVERLKG